MGSICHIWNPENWKITIQGKSKIIPSDIIYQMIIGECDDYLGLSDIIILISKINYEFILNKKYKIEKYPYNNEPILLYDENNEQVPLVKGTSINEKNLVKQKNIYNYN